MGESQMDLFSATSDERMIMRSRLESDSVQHAWYELALISIRGGFLIEKHSGSDIGGLNIEIWFRRSLDAAEKKYSQILHEKIKPDRKSPRKYHLVYSRAFA
ncbi:hypothetical protein FY034_18965 (plasmid) [Trichlorobacter lovleyi]|uniref:hypothetical protein n=1 Tax=Trichlorobacter lovleyi TaxID=313985 RepID=UPI00223EC328|nr:hypothetical protein [Trichlorobacter lovleyi]QOX81059.1 hypothetical protein FY034_18965 [Trichlorobacter lovleyi]